MIEIIARRGREDLALLYIGRTRDNALVEFVESLQPPLPREQKWVLIVSTLKGCPVRCQMCDAGGDYRGRLSAEEILAQIDALVLARFADRRIPIPKFKIQFARMGEPSLNPAVLEVLKAMPDRYNAPGLLPCLSSVLPKKSEPFFEELASLKNSLYSRGRFQLQFSLHTTDAAARTHLIPFPVLDFDAAARLGDNFFRPGDRKIGLNFAVAQSIPISAAKLREYFDPAIFMVKLTPLNPTARGQTFQLQTRIDPQSGAGSEPLIAALRDSGFDVILSLGEPEEDAILSNCGQHAGRLAVS
jgi:23S rRNA (adenine2503-C2)-methyltransferase